MCCSCFGIAGVTESAVGASSVRRMRSAVIAIATFEGFTDESSPIPCFAIYDIRFRTAVFDGYGRQFYPRIDRLRGMSVGTDQLLGKQMKTENQLLVEASQTISRMKQEQALAAEAIAALSSDNALLKARLRIADLKLERRTEHA